MTSNTIAHEASRLDSLYLYDILNTPTEEAFDSLTRLAAQICDAPMARITLADRDRHWIKSQIGPVRDAALYEPAFCAHTIRDAQILIVTDARADSRFSEAPYVRAEPFVCFYAGVPLVTAAGHVLGTLCVLDWTPRVLTPEQQEALVTLGQQVMARMDLRRLAAERERLLLERTKREAALQGQHAFLRNVIDTDPNFIFVKDAEGRFLLANEAVARAYGTSPEGLIGRRDADFNSSTEEVARFRSSEQDLLASGQDKIAYQEAITDASGAYRWLQTVKCPIEDAESGVRHVLGVCTDITDLKAAKEALRERTEVLGSVLSTVPHMVFWKDRDSSFLGCNENFARAAGLADPTEIVGRTDYDLPWTREEADSYREHDRRVMEDGLASLNIEETQLQRDGSLSTVLTSKIPLRDGTGDICGILGIFSDITERKKLEMERERLLAEAVERADQDALTGLFNHRAFHRRLEEEADRAQRRGDCVAVVMADLDNFKFFNEVYGHQAGDAVLRQIAATLRSGCRSYDTVARFGGDEFALLLPGLTADDARQLTGRLTNEFGERGFTPAGQTVTIPLGVTFGCAVYPNEAATRLDVVEMADERLRVAKTQDSAAQDGQQTRTHFVRAIEGFSMLDALVTAVDNKDRYTRRHSDDVLAYSLQIARQLGLNKADQNTVAVSALLHDVGKIGVPDAILRKPGRLTDQEVAVIKLHPTMGAAIVGAVPGFEDALNAVRHHHERWDGQGYPAGLQGTEIPLIARLMAVADAYSAMTTDRPYRKGMPCERALTILADGAGSQWDPDCITAFLKAHRDRGIKAHGT